MSSHIAFSVLTLFPMLVLLTATVFAVRGIHRIGAYKLLLLPGILLLMGNHQLLEALTYFETGTSVGLATGEYIETVANVLASVAVYYGVDFACEKYLLAEQLEESEQRYRTLTEQSPLPVFVVREGEIAFANQAASGMLTDGDPEALVGRELSQFVSPEQSPGTDETESDDPATGVPTGEQRWTDDDGEEHVVVVSKGHARYQGQESLYIVCQDVTEREAYRREYEETKAQFQTALQSSNDAIMVIDPERGEILDANERAFEMLGYQSGDLIGLPPSEIHPHELEKLDEFFERVTERGELVTSELSCMRRDGQKIPVDISASLTEYGNREAVLAVIRDRTERESRRKQIEVLRRVLRHNLRNQMTVVVGFAERIQEQAQGEVADLAAQIKDTADELVAMSDTVRDIQEIVQRDQLNRGTVDVWDAVDDVASRARNRYPDAVVTTDVPPNVTVKGNDMLETALDELVENAIEHNDADEPKVDVVVKGNDLRRGQWIDITIMDNGPGIPEHERDIIEMDGSETPLSHATGMGLWAVSQVATAFGGELTIEDHPEGGSIVTLHLKGSSSSEAEPVAV